MTNCFMTNYRYLGYSTVNKQRVVPVCASRKFPSLIQRKYAQNKIVMIKVNRSQPYVYM